MEQGSAGKFKYHHDTNKNLKFVHVFPKISEALFGCAEALKPTEAVLCSRQLQRERPKRAKRRLRKPRPKRCCFAAPGTRVSTLLDTLLHELVRVL